jgi:hypothetical protein
VFAALRLDEVLEHADSIVVGTAEKSWPQLLRDFASGQMQKLYKSTSVDLNNLPVPRRDLQKRFGYTAPTTIFATR